MYYGFPGTDAKGVIAESECYKAFRGAQLVAYRQALVATVMAEPAGLSRGSLRMLDEMRERFSISDDRHAAELEIAASDPVVKAVQQSGVFRETSRFADPVSDVPVPAIAPELDDGGRHMAQPKSTPSRKERPGPSPLPNQVPRAQPPAEDPAARKHAAALASLTQLIEATGKQFIRTRDNGERVTLRMRLKDYERQLDAMLAS
jgi:hypothetical protein